MPKIITGTVTSDRADKTVVVSVVARKTHPLYKKQYTASRKFMVHDEKNEAQVGDKVTIVECRPLSARKRFRLKKIVQRGGLGFAAADSAARLDVAEPGGENKPAAKESKE